MPASGVPDPWAKAMRAQNIGDPRNGVPSINSLADKAQVARETVRQMILGGRVPSQETVRLVAEALKVDVRKVSAWVGQARTVKEPYEPPDEAHLLDREERAVVDEVIRLFAASKKNAARADARVLRAASGRRRRRGPGQAGPKN